ncbi:MAG: response regulator [Planctomycetota bacterium]|nr:response regulator [Planctomycetota bacterium]
MSQKRPTSIHVFGPKTRRMIRKLQTEVFLATDSPLFTQIIKKELKGSGYAIRCTSDGQSTISLIIDSPPDILLLNNTLPDMSGAEVLSQLRANASTQFLPVILLSARDKVEDIAAGLEAGADDYISKPFDGRLLKARIDNQLRIRSLRNELEKTNLFLRDMGQLKDELLTLCSHDLKIPMKTILWYTELLRDGLISDPDKAKAAFNSIEDHGKRIFTYIDDVLHLAKLGSGPKILPREISIPDILEEARNLVAGPAAQRSVTLILNIQSSSRVILGEESLLVRLFQNLFANAISHGPEGGIVRVDVEPRGDAMTIQITDEGDGIPQDQISTIFTAFPTTNPFKTEGAGVGLAICHEIVDRHYGTIELKSEEGHGAIFVVQFPFSPEKVTQ